MSHSSFCQLLEKSAVIISGMKKYATSYRLDSNGNDYVNPIESELISNFRDLARSDHLMKPGNQQPGHFKKYAALLSGGGSDRAKLFYALEKSAAARTDSVRRYWCKQASDYMGNTNEQELEMAIFTLSSHFIKDKAPKLFDLNYFVGFRILDKNEDNTKVVGIYGFKIGKSWVYIPIFFDKGKINGFELCYIQNKDQFVPLKEGWIDWIIKNSGDESFGKADTKDFRQLGIRYPDMRQLTQPPVLGKVASLEPWVQQGVLALAKRGAMKDTEESEVDLEKLASSDARIFTRLAKACEVYPIIKVAMDSFYGEDFLLRTCDRLLKSRAKIARAKNAFHITPKPLQHSAVRVITQDDTSAFPFLTEKQAAELIGGPIAIDERMDDEVATVEDEIKFHSPDKTGVYDVFFGDGSFRECLVVICPLFCRKQPGRDLCLVVDWKRRTGLWAKSTAVLCVAGSYKDDWFNRLPADQFKSATSMRSSEAKRFERRVIVSPEGRGTSPLYASNSSDGAWLIEERAGDSTTHRDRTYDMTGDGVDYSISRLQDLLVANGEPRREANRVKGIEPRWVICSSTFAGKKMVIRDDKLILSEKFKFIDLDTEYSCPGEKNNMPLPLATENDVLYLLYKNRKKLRATKTPTNYVIDGVSYDKVAAFKTLVKEYDFRAKIANEILTATELVPNQTLSIPYVEARHKVADLPIDPIFGRGGRIADMPDNTLSPIFGESQISFDGYSGLPIDGGLNEAQQLGYEDQPIPIEFTHEIPPPDPMAMQHAAEAAQTGRKDVFDVANLVGILNSHNDDNLLATCSKVLKKGLDSVARVLFKLYWDREGFIDRYGEDDLEKFEECLNSVLDSAGDLTLYLLQKDDRPEVGDILENISTDNA